MKVQTVPKFDHPGSSDTGVAYGVEGTEHGYFAKDVAKIVTRYDERGLPCEVEFLNENNAQVVRVVLAHDNEGRLVKEEARYSSLFSKPVEIEAKVLELFTPEGPRNKVVTMRHELCRF